jgi:DHA1 family tetracycline resistance protein-like MFS transporter
MLWRWRSERSLLFLVALTIMIDFIGFGLLFPLLPFWAEHFGANALSIGLLLAVHALAQCIFTPIMGTLSDLCGRRPIIIVSLLIEVVALVVTALAHNLPLLFVSRFIGGMGASTIGLAQTIVADVTAPQKRAKGMGIVGAALGMGMMIGPPLGGILASINMVLPFWVATGVILFNAMLVTLLLPETRVQRPVAWHTPSTRRRMFSVDWQKVYRSPSILRLLLIDLLFALALATVISVFALFTEHHFGWKPKQVGYTLTYLGVLTVLLQGGLIGWLVKYLGEQRLLVLGLLCSAGGLVALSVSHSVAFVLLSLGVLHIGEGAVHPSMNALFSFASPADAEGETLGLAQGANSLGRMIGPTLAGGFYVLTGSRIPFLMSGGLVVAAVLLALPALPVLRNVAGRPQGSPLS